MSYKNQICHNPAHIFNMTVVCEENQSLPHVADARVREVLKTVDIIITDIDQTFMSKHLGCDKRERLLAENLAALQRVEKLGIPVAFMTGRNFCSTVDFFGKPSEWLANRPGVYGDGNFVMGQDGEVIKCQSLPQEAIECLVEVVKDDPNVTVMAFYGSEKVVHCGNDDWANWHDHQFVGGPVSEKIPWEALKSLNAQTISIWDGLGYDPHTKGENTGCSDATLEKIQNALADFVKQNPERQDVGECLRRKRKQVRLISGDCDKATAARILMRGLGKRNPLLIGDDKNDVCVFKEFPGRGVAMGNSIPETIQVAGMMTGRYDAEGTPGWAEVADAIVASRRQEEEN